MLAYAAALLLAATAAAIPNSAAVVPRSALNDTPTHEVCDPHQRLVCCDAYRCNEIQLDDHDKYNKISAETHCTAIVACCTFTNAPQSQDNFGWGDIINNNICIYKGNLLGDASN